MRSNGRFIMRKKSNGVVSRTVENGKGVWSRKNCCQTASLWRTSQWWQWQWKLRQRTTQTNTADCCVKSTIKILWLIKKWRSTLLSVSSALLLLARKVILYIFSMLQMTFLDVNHRIQGLPCLQIDLMWLCVCLVLYDALKNPWHFKWFLQHSII